MPLTEDEKNLVIAILSKLCYELKARMFVGILKEKETEIVFTGDLCPVCTAEILNDLIDDGVISHQGEHEDETVH